MHACDVHSELSSCRQQEHAALDECRSEMMRSRSFTAGSGWEWLAEGQGASQQHLAALVSLLSTDVGQLTWR